MSDLLKLEIKLFHCKGIAESLAYGNFRTSYGWLHKFKNRNNTKFKAVSGEATSIYLEDVKVFFDKVPSLLRRYSPQDYYNAGIFYCASPNKLLAFKSEKRTGGKMTKERLSVTLCQYGG